jgi:hypothetical protein
MCGTLGYDWIARPFLANLHKIQPMFLMHCNGTDRGRNVPTIPQDEVSSLLYSGLYLSTSGKVGVNSLPAVVQAPGPQESQCSNGRALVPYRPCRWVTDYRKVMLQSMTDGEDGRATRALAWWGLCANNMNLGWLKEGFSGGRGQTSEETCFQTSTWKYAISETWRFADDVLVSKGWTGTATWGIHGNAVCSSTSISSSEEDDRAPPMPMRRACIVSSIRWFPSNNTRRTCQSDSALLHPN